MKILNFFLIIFVAFSVTAQNPGLTASNGFFHTHTGRVIDEGVLQIKTNMNFFTKLGEALDNSLTAADFTAANYWLVASNLSMSYGFYNHLDFTAAIRIYQDTHYENEFNIPGDLFLSLKTGSFKFGKKRFQTSLMTTFRIPLGEMHNYPFAEYSSGALEYGFCGAISYYMDPYLPERAANFHFNLGWWNHNESGKVLYTDPDTDTELIATKNSSYLNMAFATVIPTGEFDIRFELSGILATTRPDSFVYSSEEWVFFTPSIKYKPFDWMSMDLGVDLRIAPKSDRQWTDKIVPDISEKLDLPKNYPPWKVQIGLNFNIPVSGRGTTSLQEIEAEQFEEKVEFYKLLQEEQEKSSDIEEELKMLKNEREEADKEIEELKKMLEED